MAKAWIHTLVYPTGGNYFGSGWKGREKEEEEEERGEKEYSRSSWRSGDSITIKVASSDVGRIIGTKLSMFTTLYMYTVFMVHWLYLGGRGGGNKIGVLEEVHVSVYGVFLVR